MVEIMFLTRTCTTMHFAIHQIPLALKCQTNEECYVQNKGYLGCVDFTANFCASVHPSECNGYLNFLKDGEFQVEHDYKYEGFNNGLGNP